VAYGHVGLYAEFFEKAVHRYVSREHSGLGKLGLLYRVLAPGQLFLAFSRLGPQDVGKAHAYHLFKDEVGLVESGLYCIVLGGQVPHHVNVLRALSREQQPYLGVVLPCFESVNSFQFKVERRRGPGFFFRVLDQEGYFVGQVLKETKGKANPKVVNDILKEKLAG